MLPVVGECDDGDVADSRTVTAGDVERALEALGPEVAEGTVGAGTGMICFDFPGGIGTASRLVGDHHVGVLLLCNFGDREHLDLLGTSLEPQDGKRAPARLLHRRLRHRRAARRPGSCAGWRCGRCSGWPASAPTAPTARARSGSRSRPAPGRRWPTTSSTPTSPPPRRPPQEAVYNCLVAARPAERRDGTMQEAFPVELRPRARPASAGDERRLSSRDEVVELARELIRIDTSNPPGNETPAAELLAALPARGRGRAVELVGPDPERLNLVARIEGSGDGPSLMLIAHTDVVPAPRAGWTRAAVRGRACATGG